jgi:hypothetical protein
MSILPFRLGGTIGRTSRVSADDTLRTKEALGQLGYFVTPNYGLTDSPDDALFSAIEAFQRDKRLAVDGTMKPNARRCFVLMKNWAKVIRTGLHPRHLPFSISLKILDQVVPIILEMCSPCGELWPRRDNYQIPQIEICSARTIRSSMR